jgi:uridine phosphorylase
VANRWEDGEHPIYEIEHLGKRLAFFHPGVSAPLAAGLLEEAIAFGIKNFIVCGGCGVLNRDLFVGKLILVDSALRDEGVSYHYLEPSREVSADQDIVRTMQAILSERGICVIL